MKKLFLLLILMLVSPLAQAGLDYQFDYMNIPTESFGNIYFKKSTMADVKAKYPKFLQVKMEDGSTILRQKPQSGAYSEIRVGFDKDTLQWIEFVLRDKQSIDKILTRYGTASDVNYDYNVLYNYYNYEFFNFAVDKGEQFFYSVSIFDNPKLPDELLNFDNELPDITSLNITKNFIPKTYPEEAFGDYYESLYPKFNANGTKTYTIKNNVTQKYQKAELIFCDGLLQYLILYPKDTNFAQIKAIYGNAAKVTTDQSQIIYDFGNFAVVTNLSNLVQKIVID